MKTFLPSTENHAQKVPLPSLKLPYCAIFQPATPETWQECFTLLCLEEVRRVHSEARVWWASPIKWIIPERRLRKSISVLFTSRKQRVRERGWLSKMNGPSTATGGWTCLARHTTLERLCRNYPFDCKSRSVICKQQRSLLLGSSSWVTQNSLILSKWTMVWRLYCGPFIPHIHVLSITYMFDLGGPPAPPHLAAGKKRHD